jgi:acyl-coenzyme A synthetase/AMP-(fatty) acid ligase
VAVVDEALRHVPPGTVGELCVAGPQVFSGYLENAAETRARLIQLADDRDSTPHWYRTGDIVREIAGGEHVFLGREDGQVKVGGHRVETAEIEAVLNARPEVFQSAVVLVETADRRASELVAFVIPMVEMTDVEELLRSAVRDELPDYMTPRHWVSIEDFPLNVNGKIDRKALRRCAESADVAHAPRMG